MMSIQLDLTDKVCIERCLIDSQGLYTGFFVYNGKKINEKFSLIQKKMTMEDRYEIFGDNAGATSQKQIVKLCGYG